MDPIKIPQNVYIEDRIVGPLTLRQIVIVGIGGGFSYALWAMLNKAYGGISLPLTVMVWLPAGVAAAFAFVKVNDLSLTKLCLLLLERMNKPMVRTWAPRQGFSIHIRTFTPPQRTKLAAVNETQTRSQRLAGLTATLDAAMQPPQQSPAAAQPTEGHALETEEEPDPLERTLSIDLASPGTATRLPVNKARITASPLQTSSSMDGIASTPAASPAPSVFHDILPRPAHG
jgi:hypothetical protein